MATESDWDYALYLMVFDSVDRCRRGIEAGDKMLALAELARIEWHIEIHARKQAEMVEGGSENSR